LTVVDNKITLLSGGSSPENLCELCCSLKPTGQDAVYLTSITDKTSCWTACYAH